MDYVDCTSCGERPHMDETLNCGSCEDVLCKECLSLECDICKQRERETGEPNEVGIADICGSCVSGGCEACGEKVIICKTCITEHLQTCTKKSRDERKLAFEQQKIDEYESEIRQLKATINEARSLIASSQSRLETVEKYLLEAKQRKVEVETEKGGAGENKLSSLEDVNPKIDAGEATKEKENEPNCKKQKIGA